MSKKAKRKFWIKRKGDFIKVKFPCNSYEFKELLDQYFWGRQKVGQKYLEDMKDKVSTEMIEDYNELVKIAREFKGYEFYPGTPDKRTKSILLSKGYRYKAWTIIRNKKEGVMFGIMK